MAKEGVKGKSGKNEHQRESTPPQRPRLITTGAFLCLSCVSPQLFNVTSAILRAHPPCDTASAPGAAEWWR